MVLGLVGYLNLGEPQRLALDDGDFKIKHQSLASVTQDAGGPDRLSLDDGDRIKHHNLSSGSDVSVSWALDDGNRMK